jgi:acetyl esterase
MPRTLRAGQLDREARLFLRIVSPFVGGSIDREQVSRRRRAWSLIAATFGRRVPVASVVERRIDGPGGQILMRIYRPEGAAGLRPAFLWCHGGGFVVGDLDANDSICRSVARAAQAVVVAVRYRLAPEHDLYAGREDFLAAVNWVAKHGASIGVDSARLAIGGDSAGGNIGSAVAQENLRRDGPNVQLQALVYPATDLLAEFPSKHENARGNLLTADFIDSLTPLIARGDDLTDPWLSPARRPDLRDLPPAVIVSAGFDPIRDDGLAYAARLRAAGVPVELLHYPGQFHGFLNFDSIIGAARDAQQRMGASLARAFRGEAPVDRTTEIADQAPGASPLSHKMLAELLTAALMINRSTRQITSSAAHWLSPSAASVAEFLLRPWWAPAAMMRRGLTARLNMPAAQQTYPQRLGDV